MSFVDLAGDARDRHVVVARFLAVLELYRQGAVAFEQLEPLGALLLRWSASDWDETMLDRLGDLE
jgi:segregation and condensation protein A